MSAALAVEACKAGHPYTPENTRLYFVNGKLRQRQCRVCNRERLRAMRADRSGVTERRERPALTPRQVASLREAAADGVPMPDLLGRFGINHEQYLDLMKEAAQ